MEGNFISTQEEKLTELLVLAHPKFHINSSSYKFYQKKMHFVEFVRFPVAKEKKINWKPFSNRRLIAPTTRRSAFHDTLTPAESGSAKPSRDAEPCQLTADIPLSANNGKTSPSKRKISPLYATGRPSSRWIRNCIWIEFVFNFICNLCVYPTPVRF